MDSHEGLQLLASKTDSLSREQSHDKDYKPVRAKLLKSVGYLASVATNVTLATSWNCVQALGASLPAFQLNALRFCALEILVLIVIAVKRTNVRIECESIPYMIIVGLTFNAASFTWYEAAKYLPGGTVACLFLTLTMLTTVTVSIIQTRRCQLHTMLAILLCVTGSVLYAQPDFMFGRGKDPVVVRPLCGACTVSPPSLSLNSSYEQKPGFHLKLNRTSGDIRDSVSSSVGSEDYCIISFRPNVFVGYIFCVSTAIAYTIIVMVTNSKLSKVNPIVTSFWAGLATVSTSLSVMFLFETPTLPVGSVCWTLTIAHSLTAGVDPLLQVVAARLLDPVIVMIMGSLTVVLMCVSQYSVMQHIYPENGNALTITGAVLVLLGNVTGPFYRMREDMKKEDADGIENSPLTPVDTQGGTR